VDLRAQLTAGIADPDIDALTARYAGFERTLRTSRAGDARRAVFDEWDGVRRELSTWSHVTKLRFDRDTGDAAAAAARERRDELEPKLTLAQCCAFQFWELAERDPADALDRYVRLCRRGGSLAFGELVASAGLDSPFGTDALPRAVARARAMLLSP